ncbi:unnamed protein product [Calypogeia fissa]
MGSRGGGVGPRAGLGEQKRSGRGGLGRGFGLAGPAPARPACLGAIGEGMGAGHFARGSRGHPRFSRALWGSFTKVLGEGMGCVWVGERERQGAGTEGLENLFFKRVQAVGEGSRRRGARDNFF